MISPGNLNTDLPPMFTLVILGKERKNQTQDLRDYATYFLPSRCSLTWNQSILTIIQVVNFEVVLASGEIVNANAKENSDLWVALRGGGNNLGVVTRFDFRTFEQGNVWGGTLYYFGDSFPGQCEALANELNKPDASKETHLMISM